MQIAVKLVSLVGLAAVVLPAWILWGGMLELGLVQGLALAGTLAWFLATPLWMGRE